MRNIFIVLLLTFLVGCQATPKVEEEPKGAAEMEKYSDNITKEEAIELAVEYLQEQDWSGNFYQEPLSIDEFETFWNVYFKEKGEPGKPGKCLIRVYKSTGEVERIILR